jgi:hypothetical protein
MNEIEVKMDSIDDLINLLWRLPRQARWESLKIISRMQKGRINHIQAAAEIKELFLKSGVAHE